MKSYLVFLFVLLAPMNAFAEVTWALGGGVGVMEIIDGFKLSRVEDTISKIPQVASVASIQNRTTYKTLSVSRCSNEYVCFSGAYLWGGVFSTILDIKNANVGVVNIGGVPIDFGTLPINLTLRREAEVSATQLSVLLKLPVNDLFSLFCRVGAYDYNVKTTAKILLPDTKIFLAEEENYTGLIPVASVGFDTTISKATLQVEGQRTGKLSVLSLLFVYKIK